MHLVRSGCHYVASLKRSIAPHRFLLDLQPSFDRTLHPGRQVSMEFIGVSLAVVSIVLQISELYDQIKDHSIEFHRLDQDLKCFYDALVMAKHYLHHEDLHRTRKACKDIVDDIRKLLWKRQHHSSLRRSAFKVSTSKIKDLRDRMQFHLTILHHHARLVLPVHIELSDFLTELPVS